MKKILFLIACMYAGSAYAITTSGTLYETGAGGTGSTIDYWGFSTTGGLVTIDTLSTEYYDSSFGALSFTVADVNGDGEIAFIDPFIHLFSNDGSLDIASWITENDDDLNNNGYGDGSINNKDSYLSLNLAAGDYILAIGAFDLTIQEAIDGVNDSTLSPATCTGGVGQQCGSFNGIDHGDYQITWSDNVSVVPVPAAVWLFGSGLIGLIGIARRKK